MNDCANPAVVDEGTFRDLSRLMASLLRPFEDFASMTEREGDLRAEVYKAIDAIRWGEPVPDDVWERLDVLDGRLS